jgi:two-component system, NarL family, sensor histidine kinase LiaS
VINKILNNYDEKKITKEIRMIYFYRYFSLIITSLFYLYGNHQSTIENKLFVIICLTVASIMLNYLYLRAETSKKFILVLIFVEILSNTLILIPTGGINSPFMWYSLNTVLITSYYFNIYYCALNMAVYLIFSSHVSLILFDKNERSFVQVLEKNSNLVLSFIMITAAIQLLLTLHKKLTHESNGLILLNNQLSESNQRLKQSMEHIMSLYQSVHMFNSIKDKEKFSSVLMNYAKEITKASTVFFCKELDKENCEINIIENYSQDFKNLIIEEIKKNFENIKQSSIPISLDINDKKILIIAIKSAHKIHGLLGIEIGYAQDGVIFRQVADQLRFLGSLGSIVFERFELEKINELLLVNHEQNRIANDIHDSVSQKLFAISCSIHSLSRKLDKSIPQELKDDLNIVRDSLSSVMKELRETIYDLSWRKRGASVFATSIREFIDEISRLHNIDISFKMSGNEELIGSNLKKALYRLICEGTGNAIRHGKCKEIEISLLIERKFTKLSILDNGRGFDFHSKLKGENLGLGIRNMFNLVNLFGGEFEIKSKLEQGTSINVLIPNTVSDNREDVV